MNRLETCNYNTASDKVDSPDLRKRRRQVTVVSAAPLGTGAYPVSLELSLVHLLTSAVPFCGHIYDFV